jgi:ubiquitin carboxyl-terminal hydrolase 36/42
MQSNTNIQLAKKKKRRRIDFIVSIKPENGTISSVHSDIVNNRRTTEDDPNQRSNYLQSKNDLHKRGRELFDYTVLSNFLKWRKIAPIGPGFFNEGNTCYLNSTLQCLMYIPPFVQTLLFAKSKILSADRATTGSKLILELFSSLVEEVHNSSVPTSKTISPRSMISNIRRVGKQFRPLRQEDAHEYLRQLLDCMHEEILKSYNLKTSDGKVAETSFISQVFGGYLCNSLKCTKCKYVSNTMNHFLDISLDLKGGINSVQTALQHFIKPEELTRGNEWKCTKCNAKVQVRRLFLIFLFCPKKLYI